MSNKAIAYLGAIIFLIIVDIILIILHVYFKNKNEHKTIFRAKNSNDSLWNFTKKNMMPFTIIFVLVLIISFVMLWISN